MKSIGNVFILGDSYSTFKGYIPEGYATYYGDKEREGIDVYSVDETWWMQVINRASGKLLMNCSWSGTTIGNHGWNNEDCKDKDALALVKYISADEREAKLLENQQVIKTPIVRNGKQATVGYHPEIWKAWS